MAFEFDLDRARAGRAIEGADATCPTRIATALRLVNVYDIAGFGARKRTATAYFAALRGGRHRFHAITRCALPHRPQAQPFGTTRLMALPRGPQTDSIPAHQSES